MNNVGNTGDTVISAQKLIGEMQKVSSILSQPVAFFFFKATNTKTIDNWGFKLPRYVNDNVLQIGFSESGRLLVKGLEYA